MNKILIALWACALLLCGCRQKKAAETNETYTKEPVSLIKYIEKVQHIKVDSTPLYCILFFSENCSACNYASKGIIDSICKLSLDGNLLIIVSESDLSKPEFIHNKEIIVKDYKGELAQYGLIYPRHMLFKLCNKSVQDKIEILPANQTSIFKSLKKGCDTK